MSFAERLHSARIGTGLTQTQLARRARTSQSRVSSYERGRVTPTAATQDRLMKCARHLPAVLLDQHREEVVRAADEIGLTDVRVFGSVARNEDTLSSDIDLLVSAGPHTSLVHLARFAREVEELTGYRVDVVTDDHLDPESAVAREARHL